LKSCSASASSQFGHRWIVATNTEELSDEELQRRMEEAMSGAT
jgi:hypothetical protein